MLEGIRGSEMMESDVDRNVSPQEECEDQRMRQLAQSPYFGMLLEKHIV